MWLQPWPWAGCLQDLMKDFVRPLGLQIVGGRELHAPLNAYYRPRRPQRPANKPLLVRPQFIRCGGEGLVANARDAWYSHNKLLGL
jgi:hypothetical protein